MSKKKNIEKIKKNKRKKMDNSLMGNTINLRSKDKSNDSIGKRILNRRKNSNDSIEGGINTRRKSSKDFPKKKH